MRLATAFIVLSSMTLFTMAAITPRTGGQCNTGPIQCCESVGKASDPRVQSLLNSLNIEGLSASVPVGVTCAPINVVGVAGGNSCAVHPVCCHDNKWGGVVAIGCSPVHL